MHAKSVSRNLPYDISYERPLFCFFSSPHCFIFCCAPRAVRTLDGALRASREKLLEELARIDAELVRGSSTGTSKTATASIGASSKSSRFYRVRDRVIAYA